MNLNGTKLTNHRRLHIPEHVAGIATVMEFCFRFIKWADKQPKPLSARAIQSHWEMSRATAYRWRAAYLACTGQHVETLVYAELEKDQSSMITNERGMP